MITVLLRNSILILILTIAGIEAFSCDFCELMDYGNASNKSFFKLDYGRNLYNTYNTPLNALNTSTNSNNSLIHRGLPGSDQVVINHIDDYELYSRFGLSFNYNHQDRWNLKLGTSYVSNIDNYGLIISPGEDPTSSQERFSGLGDFWLGTERIFTWKPSDRFKHILKIGAVINLPTGKFEVENVFTDNLHMQPGRSVYGLDLTGNYNFEEIGFWGINLSLEHYNPIERSGLPSTYSYTYATEYASDVSAYKIFNGELDKIILGGFRNEFSTPEFVNNFEISNTGGYTGSFIIGCGLSYKNFLFQGNFNLPIIHRLNNTQLKNTSGFNIALYYYLSKQKENK